MGAREYLFANDEVPGHHCQGFVTRYQEVFSEPPYKETYSEEWVMREVWEPHLLFGMTFLYMEGADVLGFGCALPVLRAGHEIVSFLQKQTLPFALEGAWYMSEVGVRKDLRCNGIGTELINRRLLLLKERGIDWFVVRTAAEGSNSIGIYKSIGALTIGTKDVSNEVQAYGSDSKERIYLYRDCAYALKQIEAKQLKYAGVAK